ncbi:MAG TPA: hypothetical protein VLK58_25710 [Conexibacter sp.]|nr:hypothetical protein [Conexibacter sp.]
MIRLSTSLGSGAVETRAFERQVAEALGAALSRRHHVVRSIRQTFGAHPDPRSGATWWAIAKTAPGEELTIVCELRRRWRRTAVRWQLQSRRRL